MEQHVGENREIGRGGEEPRVARDAAEQVRARIVHLALEHDAFAALGGRGPRPEGRAGVVRGVAHAERLVEVVAREDVEPLPRDLLHQLAEDDVADVAVEEALARLALRDERVDAGEGVGAAALVVADRVVGDEAPVWSRRCSMVMRSLPFCANDGRYFATGSSSLMRPCSARSITLGAVATTLVNDARSKTVSTRMGRSSGSLLRRPYALAKTTRPPRITATTAPGTSPRAMAAFAASSMPP